MEDLNMRDNNFTQTTMGALRWFLVISLGVVVGGMFGPVWAAGDKKVWTNERDWASNSGHKNVTWQEVPGQIQLIKNPPKHLSTPFIYIPNSSSNDVTQLSTKTGQKNWTVSLDSVAKNSDPSRTTVDMNGDVWVGLRNTDKVVWISKEGQIKKVVATGKRPRAITVDLDGHIWVGNYDANTLVKLDGQTGNQLLSVSSNCPYGATTDIHNNIWVANRCKNQISKVSNSGQLLGTYSAHEAYGIATDPNGQVWVADYSNGCVHRFANNGNNLGCVPLGSGCQNARGVAVDGDGNVWVACSNVRAIVKISASGQVIGSNRDVGDHCVGLAVDADGFVWAVARGDATATKINAKTTAMAGKYPTHGSGPYTYSDMTGFQFQSIASNIQGYWRGRHSAQCEAKWVAIAWQEHTPAGTSVEVRARTAVSQAALEQAQWSNPLKNGDAPPISANFWIEIEITLRSKDGMITPYVTELSVEYSYSGIEVCNGIDDDCDGYIDNIPGTDKPITRPCRTACGEGTSACIAGDWSTCSARYPSVEICHGIDDDCDGVIDDGAELGCLGGAICIGGVCLRKCTSECPSGQVCREVQGEKVCVGRTPCSEIEDQCKAQGQICRNGQCVDPCDGIECPPLYFCVEGHCHQDNCYHPKRPCPAGQICRQAKCLAHPCDGVQCSGNNICKNGQCIPTCAHVSCPAGQSCRDGKCQSDPCAGVSCKDGEICANGKCQKDSCLESACRANQSCVNGQCIDNPCVGTLCPPGQICRLPHGDCFSTDPSRPPIQPPDPQPDAGNPQSPDSHQSLPPDYNQSLPPDYNQSLPPGSDTPDNPSANTPVCPYGKMPDGKCKPYSAHACLCSSQSPANLPLLAIFLLSAILLILYRRRDYAVLE
jgi:streptogramin lyase